MHPWSTLNKREDTPWIKPISTCTHPGGESCTERSRMQAQALFHCLLPETNRDTNLDKDYAVMWRSVHAPPDPARALKLIVSFDHCKRQKCYDLHQLTTNRPSSRDWRFWRVLKQKKRQRWCQCLTLAVNVVSCSQHCVHNNYISIDIESSGHAKATFHCESCIDNQPTTSSEKLMVPVRITSWHPKCNGSHFGLPPLFMIQELSFPRTDSEWLGWVAILCELWSLPWRNESFKTLTYSHKPHFVFVIRI